MAGSLHKISSGTLHVSKPIWWLESRFHFNFADYYNSENTNFGALKVLNDDLIQPKAGFGKHPHRNAEIFSYIVDGKLSHQDSMGNKEALPRGCVQYLSAGSGISHSEMNEGSEVCRFLQVWLSPDRKGHKPQYGSSKFSAEDRKDKLLHILGGTGKVPDWSPAHPQQSSIHLHQDANIYVSEMKPHLEYSLSLSHNRQAYMVCIEGSLEINGVSLDQRDAIEILPTKGEMDLSITAGNNGTHLMLIEMSKQDSFQM